ncbi:MAG: hypothetical protein ACOX4I_00640 [Anaerovoracaceae bacterium]|jgi:hypothetical protein
MAWVDPYTDWAPYDRFTYEDMNRICGNINYLIGMDSLRTNWTQDDILDRADWQPVKNTVNALALAVKLTHIAVTDALTSDNIDNLETIISELKAPIDLRLIQKRATRHCGEPMLYAGGLVYTTGGVI